MTRRPEGFEPSTFESTAAGEDLHPHLHDGDTGRLLLRRLDEVRSRSVRFLVPGLVPLRAFTLLAGVGGFGKSTWAARIAANETRGEYGEPHPVLYVSYEDTAEEVWRPRILAADGDPSLVIEVTVGLDDGGVVVLPEDLSSLERVIRKEGVRLCVVDPIVAAIDLKLDSFKDQHVRSVLGKLRAVAEGTGCAVLGIGHLNKDASSDAYVRVANSVAFWNAARSVILVTEDGEDDDCRLISQVKSNWAKGGAVSRWRLESIVLPGEIDATTGKSVETSRLTFVCVVEGAAAGDALTPQRRDTSELHRAEMFLAKQLAGRGWRESAEVKAAAADAGFSDRTVQRAAQTLEVATRREGTGHTSWELAGEWAATVPDLRASPLPSQLGAKLEAVSETVSRPPVTPFAPEPGGPREAGAKGVGPAPEAPREPRPTAAQDGAAAPLSEEQIDELLERHYPGREVPPEWRLREAQKLAAAEARQSQAEREPRPRLGDAGYPLLTLDRAYAGGHLTARELRRLIALDAFVQRSA